MGAFGKRFQREEIDGPEKRQNTRVFANSPGLYCVIHVPTEGNRKKAIANFFFSEA
jgi:hypothetical protein